MDIRRTVIFIGLAISSYLLILAWNNDYGQSANANAPIVETSEANHYDAPMNIEQPIAQTPAGDAPNTDVPQVVNEPLLQARTGHVSQSLITVRTDVITVRIDPLGGEVVEVLLHEYPASLSEPDVPFVVLERNQRRTYTAQSGLLGRDGIDSETPARFQSTQSEYVLADGEETVNVVLTTDSPKGLVEKIFTFTRNDYLMDVTYRVHNSSDQPWQGVLYAQLKRDGSPDPTSGSGLGMQAYLGAALTTQNNRYEKVSFSDLQKGPYRSVEQGGWAAMLQHYFLSAWVPPQDQQFTYDGRLRNGHYLFGFIGTNTVIAPGEVGEFGAQLYVGPKTQKRLAEIADNLNLTVDYGWLWWIAQPLFWLLTFFHGLVGNWGFAIILLTMSIKLLFYKPSAISYRSMANMRKVAPKMQEIKEKHGDNREKLGQEMMKLYRDEKINPLGGCLPILIQMPVFIALYWVLMESVELRQAPFILWIHDMSVMDPYFILPLIMGASMFVQMKLNPTPPDPMQARVMQFMPVIFTIFFLWFPAGLVLYWVVNNLLSIAQQYWITKQIEKES